MADGNNNNANFLKIVYTKVTTNGQTELVPLKLYSEVPIEEIALPEVKTQTANTATGMLIANRYLLNRVLGQGGFGRTYLAYDQHCFNKFCVLKEFLPDLIATSCLQKSRDLFEREARILYQISHYQIPKFLACFEDNGRLFLVQEYVDGKNYSNLLRERLVQTGQAFTEVEIIQWLQQLLPVLDYIHQHGIIHRDISPDNIIFDSEKNLPVLIDFGVGKQGVELSGQMTAGNSEQAYVNYKSMVGKVGYAPHEQIRMGHCSPSSDLYALGVTAIVLLTGKAPQELLDRYSLEWLWQDYKPVSPGLAQILNKMLADRPRERYHSALEVIEAMGGARSPSTIISPPVTGFPPQSPQATVFPSEQRSSFYPQNVSHLPPQPPQIAPPPAEPRSSLHPEFVKLCHQELTNCIGPIASFLIRETLAENPNISAHLLVEALAAKIPNPKQALDFRLRLI
jgi:serine/threonine-protein kinase